MKVSKPDIFFFLSLLLALWFALWGTIWVYYVALLYAYPAGIVSFILYRKGKAIDTKKTRYALIKVVLSIGMLLSISTLVYLLLFE